jgi:hypothetical protein
VDDRRSCTVPLLALIGCYPSDVGWLNIILFMIGLLLGQFSTDAVVFLIGYTTQQTIGLVRRRLCSGTWPMRRIL